MTPFFSVNIEKKNLDGPWCRIFCVLARHCICYTTYQRPRLFNFPSRVQVYKRDSQIAPHHCARSYSRCSRKRNRLSGNSFMRFFFFKKKNLLNLWGGLGAWNGIRTALEFFHHARASSYHPGSTSSSSFALSHSSCWSYRWSEYDVSYLILEDVLNDFAYRSRTRPFTSRS